MTPQDRTLAREALLLQKLTIEQVTELTQECGASGRPFAEVAIARGFLSADQIASILGKNPPVPPLFSRLLIATMAILVALVVVGLIHLARQHEKELELADATMRSNAEAERQARDVLLARQRELLEKRQAEAKEALGRARAIMKSVESSARDAASDPKLYLDLVEATNGFVRWLEDHPDDAPVFVERARAYELRQDFERALADIDRAIALRKDLAPHLDGRLQELRLQVARPRK
jgi:tetratricopeptide (TPR) repeat protein